MNLKPRVRRLERANAFDADAWLRTLTDHELLFLLHHEIQVILADPGISAEDRAKVTATETGWRRATARHPDDPGSGSPDRCQARAGTNLRG